MLYVSGVIATFVANRSWSFGHTGTAHTAFFRYLVAYVFGCLPNLELLLIGVDYLGFPHLAVQAAAIIIAALSLFLTHKYWVFRPFDKSEMA